MKKQKFIFHLPHLFTSFDTIQIINNLEYVIILKFLAITLIEVM